ncbi:MAG: hypothetical protein GDA36_09505 [Rhodobacteraceae bacterium]|nr:hypothetical protein [Paracoccaceae bacterium]
MFGGSFDLAILSGPLALTLGQNIGQSGFGGLGLRDCRCLRGRFCPIAASASWTFCFGQPELSGCASSWHRHCLIRKRRLDLGLRPRVFPQARRGPMTGGLRMIPSR